MTRYIDAYECLDIMRDEMAGTGYQNRAMNVIQYAPTADVVSKKVFEQVRWERDTAIKQLESYGVGFCENKELTEVKYGEWIKDGDNDTPCVCSRCGSEAPYKAINCHDKYDYNYYDELVLVGIEIEKEYIKTPYCPNCGVNMKGRDKKR